MHSMMTVRSDQARVVEAKHLGRLLDQLLQPRQRRVLLLAMLMVGHQKREYVASDPPDSRLNARHRIRPDAGGDSDRPRSDVDLFGIALPLSVGPGDGEKLFGVRPCSSAKLARETGQPALVLHVQQKLCRAVRMCGDDHLLGGVRVAVKVGGSLHPTGMTRMHLEPASIERHKFVHLVELTDLDTKFFRQVQVVGRQLVLCVVAATDVAVAA
jgi:hypothetical protein